MYRDARTSGLQMHTATTVTAPRHVPGKLPHIECGLVHAHFFAPFFARGAFVDPLVTSGNRSIALRNASMEWCV
jgi:hypothetical protein